MSNAPSRPQDFKKKKKVGELLTLPSGLVIKVRSVDLVSLVISGKVPNSLLTTVQNHLAPLDPAATDDQESAEAQVANLLKDMSSEELAEVFQVMDVMVMAMAMDPEVLPAPESERDRRDDMLYVDEVDGEDKLFLFQWTQEGINQVKRFPE